MIGFMSIFWVGIIILAVALVWPHIKKGQTREGLGNSPLDILKERYARGEINREEYKEKKTDLV